MLLSMLLCSELVHSAFGIGAFQSSTNPILEHRKHTVLDSSYYEMETAADFIVAIGSDISRVILNKDNDAEKKRRNKYR